MGSWSNILFGRKEDLIRPHVRRVLAEDGFNPTREALDPFLLWMLEHHISRESYLTEEQITAAWRDFSAPPA